MEKIANINSTNYELSELEKIYCLWWHYLRQSFWYKKFCEIMHETGGEANGEKKELIDDIEEIFESIYESANKTESILTCPPSRLILRSYWDHFGNVHHDDFEKWWQKKKDSFVKDFIIDLRGPNAAENLFIFEAATRRYLKDHPNSCPTTEKMLSLVTRDQEYIYVAIPLWNLTLRDIRKQINEIREIQKEKYPSDRRRLIGIDIMLQGRKEPEELSRYLEYFILETENKLTEDEIIEKRDKEEETKARKKNKEYNKTRDELQRLINADIKRAKRIIRNLENGIFPGEYQPDAK